MLEVGKLAGAMIVDMPGRKVSPKNSDQQPRHIFLLSCSLRKSVCVGLQIGRTEVSQ